MNNSDKSKIAGGIARANSLSPERRKEIARKGALKRWGEKALLATHKGNFKHELGIDAECYVLNDDSKTPVISQRGLAKVLGFSIGGDRFRKFINSKTIAPYAGAELIEKMEKPFIFQWGLAGAKQQPPTKIHGFDASTLIDVCRTIISAEAHGALRETQLKIAKQAHIILSASAKSGIRGLVYALSGYRPEIEEIIAAFKAYVQEEAKKYEKEFPSELYVEWARLYNLHAPVKGKSWKNLHLTIDHIYYPLAKSNGELLKLLRSHKVKDGDKNKKLFQFLNEVGARALRIQLGRILEMAESSADRFEYEKKVTDRFGGQQRIELINPI